MTPASAEKRKADANRPTRNELWLCALAALMFWVGALLGYWARGV